MCVCDWHLVASQLERSDNGNTVTGDLPKWFALSFIYTFFVFVLRGEEMRQEDCLGKAIYSSEEDFNKM